MTTPISTTTTIFVSPSTPIVGGIVTLLAKVTPSVSGNPTGTVAFFAGATLYGTVPIVNKEARFSLDTSLVSGFSVPSTFTATYSGDTTYATSTITSSSVVFTTYADANGVFVTNSSNSGAFDYTQQMNYIASSLKTIAVNSSEIRNYIGVIADLASGNGVHTAGAYDWLGAASLYKYYVEEGTAANTTGAATAAVQLAANTALNAYSTSVTSLKKF